MLLLQYNIKLWKLLKRGNIYERKNVLKELIKIKNDLQNQDLETVTENEIEGNFKLEYIFFT